jgi:hypothetical protein
MSAFGGPNIVDNGLVLYLDAGNRKSYPGSGTTWFDKSGRGNNGTLTNGPTFNTGSLGSIVFDGTNDYVDCGNSPTLNNTLQISVSMWYRSNALPVSPFYTYCLMSSQQLTPPYNGIDVRGSSINTLSFAIAINNSESLVQLGNITVGQWINVVATYNGNFINGYRNGILVQSVSKTGSIDVSTQSLWIGNNPSFTPRYYNGNIATTQIYNRALTSQEILQNYNATKGRFNL